MNTRSASDRPLRSRQLATHYLKIISLISRRRLKEYATVFPRRISEKILKTVSFNLTLEAGDKMTLVATKLVRVKSIQSFQYNDSSLLDFGSGNVGKLTVMGYKFSDTCILKRDCFDLFWYLGISEILPLVIRCPSNS